MEGKRPLEEIKVLDFCWAVIGPIGTRCLADWGATVIKIESESWPDPSKTAGPFKDNKPALNRSGLFALYNCNKYSFSLNQTHPRSKDIIWKLIEWADVIAENFSAGVMDKMGFSYDEIRKVNPDIIVMRSSNQGQTGPHAHDGGFGSHVLALTGLGDISGWPDRLPSHVSMGYVDIVAGLIGTCMLLAALDYRKRTGKGQYIDLSQLESMIHCMSPLILDYTANRREPIRKGNSCDYAAPHGAYPCLGEDCWCVITIFNDEEWERFCHCIGDPPWSKDPRFADLLSRKKNEDELDTLIGEWTRTKVAEEVMVLLQAAGVPAGVVLDGAGLVNDKQLAHRGHHVAVESSEIGSHHIPNWGFRLSKTPFVCRSASPHIGEHNEFICKNILKMSDEEFIQLLIDGTFQ